MPKILIAYVPVLHEGYYRFFRKHADARILFLIDSDIAGWPDYLDKEIRSIQPDLLKTAIESWKIFDEVRVLKAGSLKGILGRRFKIVLPEEDVSRSFATNNLVGENVDFDDVFLRWDKHKVMEKKPVEADQKISVEEFDKKIIEKLEREADKSSDWWRRIGAAVVKDGKIILITHNKHVPSEHTPYAHGDPRNTLHKGVGVEYSSVLHSEAGLIAEAAKKGISLEGTSMYVSTFPCPPCAKQIAFSGIKKLFYSGGYSVLDQESILKSQGVEIIFVDFG